MSFRQVGTCTIHVLYWWKWNTAGSGGWRNNCAWIAAENHLSLGEKWKSCFTD